MGHLFFNMCVDTCSTCTAVTWVAKEFYQKAMLVTGTNKNALKSITEQKKPNQQKKRKKKEKRHTQKLPNPQRQKTLKSLSTAYFKT